MQLVNNDFKVISGLPIIDELLDDKEICIMDKETHLFYARYLVYPSFGKSFCMDRFLSNLQYNKENKSLIITLEQQPDERRHIIFSRNFR